MEFGGGHYRERARTSNDAGADTRARPGVSEIHSDIARCGRHVPSNGHGPFYGDGKRIAAASKYVKEFGIATECGMSRQRTPELVEKLLEIHAEVAVPAPL